MFTSVCSYGACISEASARPAFVGRRLSRHLIFSLVVSTRGSKISSLTHLLTYKSGDLNGYNASH